MESVMIKNCHLRTKMSVAPQIFRKIYANFCNLLYFTWQALREFPDM